MKIRVLIILTALLLTIALIGGCSSTYSSPTTSTTTTSAGATTQSTASAASSNPAVNISGFAFSPQTLTVAKGTTVTWTNNDATTHTVTSDTGVWDSGDLAAGKTFSYTFNQTGTFPYHCKIHTTMTAKVVVQ